MRSNLNEEEVREKIVSIIERDIMETLGLPRACSKNISVFFYFKFTHDKYTLRVYHELFREGVFHIYFKEFSCKKGLGEILADFRKDLPEIREKIFFLETMYRLKLPDYHVIGLSAGINGAIGEFSSEYEGKSNALYSTSYKTNKFVKLE